ncbi:MAG: polysaccharide deacetylase family protein [Clostridiales bacterium]|nr:polysaccharide deacetylase family protein [Clostridiales bacterium]
MLYVIIRKKSIKLTAIFVFLIGTLMACIAFTQGAAMVLGLPVVRASPINSVASQKKKVALTFNSSTSGDFVDDIIKILQECDVESTFFVSGDFADANSAIMDKLVNVDKIEVGNHSNSKMDLTKLSASQIELELSTANGILSKSLNDSVKLFRAPQNNYNSKVLNVAKKLGLYSIGFDINPILDADTTVEQISTNIIKSIQKGSIILLDNQMTLVLKSLPAIIEGIKNAGFEFSKVSDMIFLKNYKLDANGRQFEV